MKELLDKGIRKLKEEQEYHCKTHILGKLTKPRGTTVRDDEGNEFIVAELGGGYELLPGRRNNEDSRLHRI